MSVRAILMAAAAAKTVAPIQMIGTPQKVGGYWSAACTLPAGMIAGDTILVAVVAMGGVTISTSGYTKRAEKIETGYSGLSCAVFTKVFASGDVSVNVSFGSYASGNVLVYGLRNVNTTTPLDTSTTISSTGFYADPPAITPVTQGAWVVAVGAFLDPGGYSSGFAIFPAGYSNPITHSQPDQGYGSGNRIGGVAWKLWSGAGAEDPGKFQPSIGTGADVGFGITLALRPG